MCATRSGQENLANHDPTLADALATLSSGDLHYFSDWPPSDIPKGPPGVYSIWRDREFLYVGMSYRDAASTKNPQARGVVGRLGTHASGRRSGDQFNIYVCDHFVVPELIAAEHEALRNGERFLDRRTREYIAAHLSFRVWLAPSGSEARRVEAHVRRSGLPEVGQPRLNPA